MTRPHAATAVRIPPLAGHPLVVAAVFAVLMLVAGQWAVPPLFMDLGWPEDIAFPVTELVVSTASYYLVTVVLEGRRPPRELALSRSRGLLGGLALGTFLCCAVFLICWVMGWRTVVGDHPHEPLLAPFLVYGLCVGFTEEIMFRGILFRLVEKFLGTWTATALSGLVFGLLHLTNPHATVWGALAIALEAGVAFGLLYRLTDSLWWVIGVHAAWNFVQGPVLGSSISGATPNGDGLLDSLPAGPAWLSGGQFGLEATPAGVVVWLLLSLFLGWRIHREGLARAGWLTPRLFRRRRR